MELKQIKNKVHTTVCNLLIVPYGIETHKYHYPFPFLNTFNRTLWN